MQLGSETKIVIDFFVSLLGISEKSKEQLLALIIEAGATLSLTISKWLSCPVY